MRKTCKHSTTNDECTLLSMNPNDEGSLILSDRHSAWHPIPVIENWATDSLFVICPLKCIMKTYSKVVFYLEGEYIGHNECTPRYRPGYEYMV